MGRNLSILIAAGLLVGACSSAADPTSTSTSVDLPADTSVVSTESPLVATSNAPTTTTTVAATTTTAGAITTTTTPAPAQAADPVVEVDVNELDDLLAELDALLRDLDLSFAEEEGDIFND